MRGYSLRALAELLNGQYSHTTLQKYEKGEIGADTELLAILANSLDLRADYFMKSDDLKLELVEYRKFSKLAKKEQKKIEEEAFEYFERYLEIESILSIHTDELPTYDLTAFSGVELNDAIEKGAVALRKKWELGLNPIPNVHAMLEQEGVKVKLLEPRPGFDGFSAFAKAGQRPVPAVALSEESSQNKARQRFTAIHELGHLVLKLQEHMTAKEKENACHRFAGAFLIPKSEFVEIFGRNRVKISVAELKAIKEDWGISCAAIMKRAHNLGLITDGRYKSFNIVTNKWGWRKEEPGHWVGDEESNRFQQLVYRALAEEVITVSKACGLLNLTNKELAEKFDLVG
jgi:Zn-dependent peptidase ImmA (M78 family)